LIQGNDADKGWTSPYILTLFAVAAVAMAIFIVGELRMKNPMLDLRLFANLSFTGAAIVAFALSGGLFALFFYLTLYLQNYLGFSAFNAGVRTLPLSALIMVTAPIDSAFVDRVGPKILMTVGMAMAAVAVLLMARISPTDTQLDWVVLLPAFVLGGLASGLVSPLISNVAVSTVSYDKAGMASGVSGVCRQVGTAFGIALLGALLTNWYNSGLHDKISKITIPGQPPAQQHAILSGIITNLQNAGTFAGSTGLRNPPAQFAQFVHQPDFPLIQKAVQESYISATTNIFIIAAILLALGTIASLVLIRRKDIQHMAQGTAIEM
ncbi:MAG TPA: MFS transporter, partial [Ktedonobacterales bacterium]|nr:MFS transporter [Ktedonobacterales bacterium]